MPETSENDGDEQIQFEVRVSHEHARLALKRFFFGLLGNGWLFGLAVLVCATCIGLDLRDGSLEWLSVAIVSMIGMLAILIAAAYIQRRRRVVSLIDQLGGEAVTYQLRREEFATSSPLGSSTLKWSALQELRIDNDLALLFYARGAYTTLPVEQLNSEAIDYLKKRVSAHGGKVVDNRK